MGSPVVLDFSKAVPIDAPETSPAQALQHSVAFGATQNPDQYAKLLQLKKQTGVPPQVAQGNEADVQHAADVNSLDYEQLAAAHPRTTAWASKPDNAAVAGVSEIQRLADMELARQGITLSSRQPGESSIQSMQPEKTASDYFWMSDKPQPVDVSYQNLPIGSPERKQAELESLRNELHATVPELGMKPQLTVPGAIRGSLDMLTPGGVGTAAYDIPVGLGKAAMSYHPSNFADPGSSIFDKKQAFEGLAQAAEGAGTALSAGVGAGVVEAPLRTAAALIGYQLASEGASKGAAAMGWSPEAQRLVGALSGLAPLGAEVFTHGAAVERLVTEAEQSKLRERSPEAFHDAMSKMFEGDPSLRIPAEEFQTYFQSKQLDPAQVAQSLGSKNFAEAVLSGGDVEVPTADFLSKLDPEHQKALLGDIVNPAIGMTQKQYQSAREEIQTWMAGGGAEKLRAEMEQSAPAEPTPEYQQVRDELKQRYVAAGETEQVADTYAEAQANLVGNLAKNFGMEPTEALRMFNPQVKIGSAAEGALNQADENSNPRGWFRALPDGSIEIGRTKIGDLSTFVHEPAHAYLYMLSRLTKERGDVASETIQGDTGKILDFLGAKDLDSLTTEQHEKFAKATEQYLREGNAPSKGLKGVFQRISVWLRSVYQKASSLGVELDPEIRGVFDRMYAAEEGVDRAREGMSPQIITSPEEAGWTDEEFQKYAEAKGLEVEQAKSEILSKLNEASVRDRSTDWREEQNNTREAVTTEIDRKPEYAALRSLRKGALDDGTPLSLNREELIKQFGEERVKNLQKQHIGIYRKEGGTDPETAAEILGFDSAEQMMRSLESAPRRSQAIEQATRAAMTAKHGDIRYDGSLADQANIAVENERRAENLHKELQALARKNNPEYELRAAQREAQRLIREQNEEQEAGQKDEAAKQRQQARIDKLQQKIADLKEQAKSAKGAMSAIQIAPIEAYRDAAKQMVEAKPIADLQPHRYLDASRKYSREAFDAARKGDAEEAAQAKHKELMNHFLFREATKAKDYVAKFENYAAKSQSSGVQGKLGKAGGDYLEQFNQLLTRYGLRKGQAQPQASLADWAREQFESGKESAIDPALFDEARTMNYKQATVTEIRAVHDALINIRHLASQELEIDVNGRKVKFAESIAEMSERARESMDSNPQRILKRNATIGEKATDLVQRGDALLMRTERLVEWLDGGKSGPWHDSLWNLAADSQGREYALQEEVTKQLGDVLERMPKEQRMQMLQKVTVDGVNEEVTRHDLISWALNMGNEGNMDRLKRTFLAHGWDVNAIENAKGMLTREEWGFVQGIWDLLKPLGERMVEMEKRLTGLPPVMVKSEPFSVSPNGDNMTLAGGYYPIMMDPRFSSRGAMQDSGESAQNLMEAGYGRATTSRGYTKARVGFGGPLLLDHEQVLTQHTAKVIKDITHREFILAASKILMDQSIRNTLRETLGPAYEEQMMPWLRTVINDRNGSATQGLSDFSRLVRATRSNLTVATLSFKISTSLLQWTHAPRMLLYTKPGSYSQAIVDFLAKPVEMTQQIKELSPNEMRFRGENLDRDIREKLNSSIGQKSISKTLARVGNVSIKYTDHMLSFPLWLSVYRDALKEHVDLPESEAKYQAMQKADSAVRMGLGSAAPKDIPPIMRNNELAKLLTMFYSFHNGIYNQIRDVGHEARNSDATIVSRSAKLTYGLALSVLAPAVLSELVRGNQPKKDENDGLWAAKRALLFGADTIPGLRDVASAIDRDGDVKFTPLMNVLSKGAKATMHAMDDKPEKDWSGIGLDYLEVGSDLAGIPGTTQAMKPIRYYKRASQGKIPNPNAFDAFVGSAARK